MDRPPSSRANRAWRLAGGPLVVVALTAGAGPGTDRGATLAIEHVTVVPMDAPRLLRDHSIVIVGDRITQVGPSSAVRVPARATRISGRGRFLMPALADLHVHIWQDADFVLYVANGVTVVRNMNGTPAHLEWRDEIRRGARLGPDLYTTGPTIYSQPADADASVAGQKRQGYDFVKLYHFVPVDGYRAVLEAARRHGMRVVGHRPSRVTSADAVRMGMESLEHLLGYAIELERQPSPLREALARGEYSFRYTYAGVTIDESRLAAVASDMQRAGGWICPTLVVMDRWAPSAITRPLLSAPYMRYVPPAHVRRWANWDEATFTADWTPEAHAQGKRVRRVLTKRLHRAGVRLLLGTDAGGHYTAPGYSIHEELAALVEAGLTPFEALQTGTRAAAQYLGLGDTWGVVRPGARADLILLDRNPLERVEHLGRPTGVIVRGRWLARASLDRLLERQRVAFKEAAGAARGG
jgi:imidazolonepropionase-like amidohydrolase